ncbi:hypothetical protein FXO37_18152 [Capsicum annuum]|nr:hypothetical protein FXO37_18152 [Capsicum annuum]
MEIRQKKEEVKAKHTTHNGVPAVMFNASDYYGIMAEECRLTICGSRESLKLRENRCGCKNRRRTSSRRRICLSLRVLERKRAIEQQKLEEQNREKDNAKHTNGERQNEQGRTPEMDNIDNDDENNLEKHEGKKDASNKVEREKKDNLTTISERINKDKKKEKKRKLPKKKSKVSFKPNIVQQIGKRTKKNQLKAASKVKALEEAIKTPINSNDNRENDLNRNNNEEVGQIPELDEIKEAVFNMSATSAVRPHGYLDTVSRSSAEAEFRSMATCSAEVTWLLGLFQEQGVQIKQPVDVMCDNKEAIQIEANPIFHERTKHIDINCHFVREIINQNMIKTNHVNTGEQLKQLTDILTKALGRNQHEYLLNQLGMKNLFKIST